MHVNVLVNAQAAPLSSPERKCSFLLRRHSVAPNAESNLASRMQFLWLGDYDVLEIVKVSVSLVKSSFFGISADQSAIQMKT